MTRITRMKKQGNNLQPRVCETRAWRSWAAQIARGFREFAPLTLAGGRAGGCWMALVLLLCAPGIVEADNAGVPPAPVTGTAPAPVIAVPGPIVAPAETVAVAPRQLSIVRVNVTNQPYDFARPWGKRSPYSRRAIGAVLPNNRVLVTGELLSNASYIEFETPEGGRKVPAEVEAVDYEANLGLLKTSDPDFLKPFVPLELAVATVGDAVSVWQLENNGNLLVTRGTMTTAEMGRNPLDDSSYLIYRLTSTLQARDSSYTMPIVKEGKLIGILSRFEAASSNAEVVPTPVIEHFLRDIAQPPYEGFPRAGIAFSSTRDPQLRQYLGLNEQTLGGVYLTEISPGGPSEKAGLRKGDVLLRVDDQPVDQDGNYADPVYGKIAVGHLLSTRHFVGDTLKFTIWRERAMQDVKIVMTRRAPHEYVIDPYIIDRPPKFYVLGGLLLQELSRQFLREWGNDWVKKAPEELVYLERQQNELFREQTGRKIVFLSRVLPTDATVGYEELHYLIVTRINGREILSLKDIPPALAKAENNLHKIEFSTDPRTIYLNASQVQSSDAILAKTYRLPALKRLE
jgi:S1-C subfamily serine protease